VKTRLVILFLLGISTVCTLVWPCFGLAYDSPGIKGVLFWISLVAFLSFWAVSEVLFALHGGDCGAVSRCGHSRPYMADNDSGTLGVS
jgi:hypothetical protein